jgi:Zn-dependent M28 family amino/carboxypeptidase
MGAESVSWATGDVELVVVGPEADARDAVFGRLRSGGDALILLDPSHSEILSGRMGQFLRGESRTLRRTGGSTVVVALVRADADATYRVDATASVRENPLMNVVGVIPGRRTDEIVVFSAHYDHVGVRSGAEGDSIFNGANDDASGTSAVIALAKYYAQRGTPERTLLFAAFTAEEAGGYGSRHFSEQLDPNRVVAMFNIEMIGKPAVEGPNTAWITGFDRSSFGEILRTAVEGTDYAFYPDPYPEQNLFYRSDNATLARLGVPAHSISTTPIDVDTDYHQATDEVGTLDLEHMTATIRAIATAAETIISAEATPTRVDPATLN